MSKRTSIFSMEITFWVFGLIFFVYYLATVFSQKANAEQAVDLYEDSIQQPAITQYTTKSISEHSNQIFFDAKPDVSDWSNSAKEQYFSNEMSQSPIAVLKINSLNLKVPIFDGATDAQLIKGAGWIDYTSDFDDETGNIGVAGHRDSWFRPLKNIEIGHIIEVQTNTSLMKYQVFQTQIVKPNNVDVLRFTPSKQLTLVTCYPFYFVGDAPERFIVMAKPIDITENKYEVK